MRNFSRRRSSMGGLVAGAASSLMVVCAATASAEDAPAGFAVERLYSSAPGAGWLVMDALDMRGGLGGALSFATGYAHNPLRLVSADGAEHLRLVEHQAFFEFGAAVTYDRLRMYFNMSSPILVRGESGSFDGYRFAPGNNPSTQHDCSPRRVCADFGWNPDTVADPRVGVDTRLFGDPRGPFRLGLGAQLLFPSGLRSDYLTDGTYRAMGRLLFAGDIQHFAYAGHVGVHLRPLDDGPTPGSPRGNELLFGAAAGPRLPLGSKGKKAVVVGPEIFGQSAFDAFLGKRTTGVEALLSARYEGTGDDGGQVRVKLGTGGGLSANFGTPEWRVVFAVELFDHGSDRDHDGVTDSKDACPDAVGVKTDDPRTNGCPAVPPRVELPVPPGTDTR